MFSLGPTLWFMMSGKSLFEHCSTALKQILEMSKMCDFPSEMKHDLLDKHPFDPEVIAFAAMEPLEEDVLQLLLERLPNSSHPLSAFEFTSKLLSVEFWERPTALQAFQHPFIATAPSQMPGGLLGCFENIAQDLPGSNRISTGHGLVDSFKLNVFPLQEDAASLGALAHALVAFHHVQGSI